MIKITGSVPLKLNEAMKILTRMHPPADKDDTAHQCADR